MSHSPASGGRVGTKGSAAAAGATDRGSGAGPAVQRDRRGSSAPAPSAWPLQSRLALAALPSAVPCARLHARQLLWEWGLAALAETVELLVSELTTNAVNASSGAPSSLGDEPRVDGLPVVQLCLASDRRTVLVQVWDSSRIKPRRRDAPIEAESGRGLLLVEHLSAQWGCYLPEASAGKVVWAIATQATI
jgi:anti-sigma regulatory factor (Ser/Thr protein kinase)